MNKYEAKKSFGRNILIGFGIMCIGILITWLSYRSAVNGGAYILWYGMIGGGFISMARNFYKYMEVSSEIDRYKYKQKDYEKLALDNIDAFARSYGYENFQALEISDAQQSNVLIDINESINVRANHFAQRRSYQSFVHMYDARRKEVQKKNEDNEQQSIQQ